MKDSRGKKIIRGIEKVLTWVGLLGLAFCGVGVVYWVFIFPYLAAFVWDWDTPWVVYLPIFMLQAVTAFVIGNMLLNWVEKKLSQLHEWAHYKD